jgi:hypothetical protein
MTMPTSFVPPIFFVPGEAYVFVKDGNPVGTVQQSDIFKELQKAGAELEDKSVVKISPSSDLALVRIIFPGLQYKKNNPKFHEDNAKLLRLVLDANNTIRANGVPQTGIVGISPNWIAEASPDPAPNGGGGPGEHHVKGDPTAELFQFLPKDIPGQGDEVHVYVLDSFPANVDELVGSLSPQFQVPSNPMPTDVINDLNVTPINELCLHPYYVKHDGVYDCESDRIPSHGLFAANIINKIAPKAFIHLVPVLNDKAIGTMISLAKGLASVYADVNNNKKIKKFPSDKEDKPRFVVNMSLAYPNPHVIAKMFWLRLTDDAKWANISKPDHSGNPKSKPLSDGDQQLKELAHEVSEAMNCSAELTEAALAFSLPGSFIASAGNDQTLTGPTIPVIPDDQPVAMNIPIPDNLPMPDYPAIDGNVISVGALNQDMQHITSYTNIASYNRSTDGNYLGIWTLGGDYQYDPNTKSSPNPTGGILGQAEPGDYYWWAGTSFAAPIVSGAQARLFTNGGNQLVTTACVSGDVLDPKTGVAVPVEFILKVKQV